MNRLYVYVEGKFDIRHISLNNAALELHVKHLPK